jgi:hypothetical protein
MRSRRRSWPTTRRRSAQSSLARKGSASPPRRSPSSTPNSRPRSSSPGCWVASSAGCSSSIGGLAAGRHRVEATATNAAGQTATRGADVVAEASPPPPTSTAAPAPAAAPSPADTTAPQLSELVLRRELFAPRCGLPRGSAVRFSLSEAARVELSVVRGAARSGARSRCLTRGATAPSRRTGRVLAFSRDLPAGENALPISGRDARGKRLPRGRSRLSVRAVDGAGNRSALRLVRFTLC